MSKVVIAGATGFVGRELSRAICGQHHVIGLTRSANFPTEPSVHEWRRADLFSMKDARAALQGADYAFYLVHSMMPSARLTQGEFQDFDLIAADHFARAASEQGVKQIIYLGGLIPQVKEISKHLESRLEVENTLGTYGVPLTTLRAGLVVGAKGSSFQLLEKLIQRLPVLVCPAWTQTKTQPIALTDIIQLLKFCLGNPQVFAQSFDVGSPDVLSYREMMEKTAQKLGLKRHFIRVPFFSPGLSRAWVTTVTGAPKELVFPLIESLAHPMVARDHALEKMAGIQTQGIDQALTEAVQGNPGTRAPRAFRGRTKNPDHDVRSVQRLPLSGGNTAEWTAKEYLQWLPKFMPWIIRVDLKPDGIAEFVLRGTQLRLLILQLSSEMSTSDRQIFYVRGGVLAKQSHRGRVEFMEALQGTCVLSALHEFRPRLPWLIYYHTQAKVHLYVMKSFARYLSRLPDAHVSRP